MNPKESLQKDIVGPAVITMAPFKSNFDLDLDALKENLRYIIDRGIKKGKGFLICPAGVGEYVHLTKKEHKAMTKAAVDAADGDIPVITGVAGTCLKDVIELCQHAEDVGSNGVMVPPPYYYVPDDDELFDFYKALSDAINIGIMIYVQPWHVVEGRSGDIEPPLMDRLLELENLATYKFSTFDTEKYRRMHLLYADKIPFIDSTMGHFTTLAHMYGAKGYITGPANFWPEFEANFWDLLQRKEYEKAAAEQSRLTPFWEFYYRASMFAKVCKPAMEFVGLRAGPVRPPFRNLTESQKKELKRILEEIGVPVK